MTRRRCQLMDPVIGDRGLGIRGWMIVFALCIVSACGGTAESSGDAAGQGDGPPAGGASTLASARKSVPIAISGEIGEEAVRVRGQGECTYAEQAYIRGVPSKMWHVQYSRGADEDGGISHANLTIWRPEGGGVDQISFSMEGESGSHRVNTVVGSELEGSGMVMINGEGEGIRVALDGRDAAGTLLRLTIRCDRVTPAVAEGG